MVSGRSGNERRQIGKDFPCRSTIYGQNGTQVVHSSIGKILEEKI